ncbi:MAG TPA: hypothetical protein VIM56_01980 [Rhizomicrobium sp.]
MSVTGHSADAEVAIAQFSALRTCAFLLLGSAFCAFVIFAISNNPQLFLLSSYSGSRGLYRLSMGVTGVLLLAFFTLKLLTILRQLVFKERSAVWMHDERLFFIDTYGFSLVPSVPTMSIASVSVAPVGLTHWIVLGLKTGSEVKISSSLLSGTPNELAARLERAIEVRANR